MADDAPEWLQGIINDTMGPYIVDPGGIPPGVTPVPAGPLHAWMNEHLLGLQVDGGLDSYFLGPVRQEDEDTVAVDVTVRLPPEAGLIDVTNARAPWWTRARWRARRLLRLN